MRRLRGRAGESRNWFQCTEHRAEHRAERTAKHTAKHTAKRTARTTRCTRRDSTRRVTSPRRTSRWACSRQTTRRLASTCPRWAARTAEKKKTRPTRERGRERPHSPLFCVPVPLTHPSPCGILHDAASSPTTFGSPPLSVCEVPPPTRAHSHSRTHIPIHAFPHPRATV